MSDVEKKNDDKKEKKLSFFERLIVGNGVPKTHTNKSVHPVISEVIEVRNSEVVPLSSDSLSVPEVSVALRAEVIIPEHILPDPVFQGTPKLEVAESHIEKEKVPEPVIKKLAITVVEDAVEQALEIKEEKGALRETTSKVHEPVPFDESALFVPLRSVRVETNPTSVRAEISSEGLLSEAEYFYLGNGKALTSLADFLVYIESLSDGEWKDSVQDRKSHFVIWIETVFGTGKLARLIELADSQKEAVLYIRSFLGK